MLFTLELGRQTYKVMPNNPEFKKALNDFNKQFITYRKENVPNRGGGRRRFKRVFVVDKLYIVKNEFFGFYIYPKMTLHKFVEFLKHLDIGRNMFKLVEHEKPKRYRVDIPMSVNMPPRDYQKRYISVMSKQLANNTTYLVDLQTGKGKTYIACSTISKLGLRTAVLVKANFVKKWKRDLMKMYDLNEEDVYTVNGSDCLNNLMLMSKENNIPKFIIFSAKTMQLYINSWESMQFKESFNYEITPDKLLKALQVSIILVDEAHKEFHSIYKTVLSLDPTLLIGLSATLLHKDKRISETYEYLYPKDSRLSFLKLDVYANSKSIMYKLPIQKNFRYTNGSFGYSQTTFEESIIKDRHVLYSFVRMVLHNYKINYLDTIKKDEKLKNKKLMLFFSSVEMCTIISKVLDHYHGFSRNVYRYVGGDDYNTMLESDVIVTTPGSSGEAIDVPGLIKVHSYVANDSIQQNLQMLGRLREDKDVTVEYIWFWCFNIPNHRLYNDNRIELFTDRVLKIENDIYIGVEDKIEDLEKVLFRKILV